MSIYIINAIRGETICQFEIDASCPDEAGLLVERDLAGEWEWDRIEVEDE